MVGLPLAGDALVHGLFMGLGILVGIGVFAYELRRRRITDDRLWVVAGVCLVLAAVGSRVGTWWQQLDPSRRLLEGPGVCPGQGAADAHRGSSESALGLGTHPLL